MPEAGLMLSGQIAIAYMPLKSWKVYPQIHLHPPTSIPSFGIAQLRKYHAPTIDSEWYLKPKSAHHDILYLWSAKATNLLVNI